MNIFHLPDKVRALIFDIDSTLYTNEEWAFEQVDAQIRYFASLRGMSVLEARTLIQAEQERVLMQTGAKPSLGNTLTAFGIPISESIRWRQALLEPGRFLGADQRLQATLTELATRFTFIACTNNPVLPARKTLQALGVDDFFPVCIGLDTTGVSKPHELPFRLACTHAGASCAECLSIGDRYEIDIALPLELGMGGILVDGVEDVYRLPAILL